MSEKVRKRRRADRRVLDAYRADVSRSLARVLGGAAALVLLGSFVAGSALVEARLEGVPIVVGRRPTMMGEPVSDGSPASSPGPSPGPLPLALGLGGLLLVGLGAGTAIFGLRHVLREERYLLLRRDGAVFVRGQARRVVKWHRVEDVVAEDGQLVLRCHDGTALTVDERWSGVTVPELARRAAQLRRRALMGLG